MTTDVVWLACIAEIKCNNTGEIRQYETTIMQYADEVNPFTWIWEEGSFSSDCIRLLFFQRANNEVEDRNVECTDYKFSVNLKYKVNNEYFYREFN